MQWKVKKYTPPEIGTARIVKSFAIFPTDVTDLDGNEITVWFESYIRLQIYRNYGRYHSRSTMIWWRDDYRWGDYLLFPIKDFDHVSKRITDEPIKQKIKTYAEQFGVPERDA